MRLCLRFPVTGYRVKAEVTVPDGAARTADLLPVHRELSGAITRAVVEREESGGRAISCRKGCSACCRHLYVEVTEAEAYRLQDTIQVLPEDLRWRVQKRFVSIRRRLREAGLFDEMLHTKLSDSEARQQLSVRYLDQGIACPFLEDDICAIYSERPLACREYLVTSPAEQCASPSGGGVHRVPFPWSSIEPVLRMTRQPFGEERLIPLALLPDWIATNPELNQSVSGAELLVRSFSTVSFYITMQEQSVGEGQLTPRSWTEDQVTQSVGTQPVQGYIVPDYEPPAALMVPHYGLDHIDLLEQIASKAARFVGVILLTPDPDRTRAFIDRQESPERFSLLVAASNTAWIRDRAPIAVREMGGGIRWCLPSMPDDGREADASLFESICARPTHRLPFTMARGNVVAGPEGLALSTIALLEENTDKDIQGLIDGGRQLGIDRWILFPAFSKEASRHADVHVRFLDTDLAAIAWNLSSAEDRARAEELEKQLVDARPSLRVLRLPIRSEEQRYASPLNWIQLGKDLLVPRYLLTEDADVDQIRQVLKAENFRPLFIDSPTLDLGGALHCLTASIYV